VFLVSHTRKEIRDAKARNAMEFAARKATRRKDREHATKLWEGTIYPIGTCFLGSNTIHVEDKYTYT